MARQKAETTATTGLGLSRDTLLRAALAGGVLLLGVGLVAWMGGERKEAPMEPYRRLGSTAGPIALQHDLQARFPSGTPIVPVIRHLEGEGFGCAPQGVAWRCTYAAPRAETRRIWRAEVTLTVDRDATSAIAVRFLAEVR
jgi:hypothetical protein